MMKKMSLRVFGFAFLCAVMWASSSRLNAQTITFEDLSLPGANTFVNNVSFSSGGAGFNNAYDNTFQSWGGWSYANSTNISLLNVNDPYYIDAYQYSAYTLPSGGGAGGSSKFGVAYYEGFTPTTPLVTLPAGTRPTSMMVTNTTYAALTMQNGSGPAKKFGEVRDGNGVLLSNDDPDFFKLIITGKNDANQTVGSPIEFLLADYRFANNAQDYIVNQWTSIDLSSLVAATKLQFDFASSDNDPLFGSNIPSYVAVDNLVVVAVPEPGTVGWVASLAIGAMMIFKSLRNRASVT
jgi:hypothetical protein